MHFARTEEQDQLASTIHDILAKRSDSAAVRAAVATPEGFDTALWQTLCEQIGVAALAVPEEYDGVGASPVEVAIVAEELGEFLTPAPFLATSMAILALLLHGSAEARAELLPRLAAGEIGTVALSGDDLILDAPAATIRLAVRGDDLVRLGGEVECVDAMDQTMRFGRVADGEVQVIGTVEDPRLLAAARTSVSSALQVGAMRRALDMTVSYSKERHQFGRPIGSFQALKHRMAEMLVRVEAGRSASWGATAAFAAYLAQPGAETAETAVRLARVAGAYCTDALDLVASECVQLHGGIAITWEHDAQLVFKRAHALAQLNGPAHRHRATLLDQAPNQAVS